jgi:hypothetical protein
MYHIFGYKYGMSGSPRFLAVFRSIESGREHVEFLIYKDELDKFSIGASETFIFASYGLFHRVVEIFPYDIYNLAESGTDSIVN